MTPERLFNLVSISAALALAGAVVGLLRTCRSLRDSLTAVEEGVARLNERLSAAERRSARPRPGPAGSGPQRVSRRVHLPHPSGGHGPTLIAVPDLSASATRTGAVPPADPLAGRFGGIWKLGETGSPPEAIAKETGLPVGRVELILGLRRRPAAPPASAGPDDA